MTRPTVIYWPPSGPTPTTLTGIAAVQDVALGDFVQLKANNPGLSTGYFSYSNIVVDTLSSSLTTNIIRSIKIKSTAVGAIRFTITGIGTPVDAGNPTGLLREITEVINGAGGVDTIDESVNIYTQINSIEVTLSAATNLSVGYGSFGITNYVNIDYNRIATQLNSWSLQFIPNPAVAGLQASVSMSLNKPEIPSQIGNIIPHGLINGGGGLVFGEGVAFIPAFQLQAPTPTNARNAEVGAFAVIWATITGGTTDSMIFTYLQPGMV